MADGLQEVAADLVARAKRDPRQVLVEGNRVLPRLRHERDLPALSMTLRAMGEAARWAGTLSDSLAYLEQSIGVAARLGDESLEADALLTLSSSQLLAGDNAAALESLDRAEALADDATYVRVGFQRALLLSRMARPDEALALYDQVLPLFRARGDRLLEAMSLHNRGNLEAYAGDLDRAHADLAEAIVIYADLRLGTSVAGAQHSLGQVATYRGDLPAALALFDKSEERLGELMGDLAEVQVSRCEALLAAGLFPEAQQLAVRICHELGKAGLEADMAEATLVLAQAALLAGDIDGAATASAEAIQLLERQDRAGWLAHAHYLSLQAEIRESRPTRGLQRRARQVVEALTAAGQLIPAAGASVTASRIGIELGDLDGAAADLDRVTRFRKRGPIELRIQAWLGTALLRDTAGDPRGAAAAVRAGLAVMSDYQAALGATDVRVGVAQHAAELADMGLRLAVRAGRPRRVWAWMERTRAGAMRFRPALPPQDAELARDLAELRTVGRDLRVVAPGEAPGLHRRQARLQEAIRRRSRHAVGESSGSAMSPDHQSILDHLDGAELVELAAIDGSLVGVNLGSASTSLIHLGAEAAVERSAAAVRLAMGRLLRSGSVSDVNLVEQAAHRLDDLLLTPLGLSSDRLVIVPPPSLLSVPWTLLPSCRSRVVTVAPSAGLWLRASLRPRRGRDVVLAAGPGLQFATREVRDLAATYLDPLVFDSRSSIVAKVLDALDGALMAHFACHGVFHDGNPLFSAMRLADGDLTVYDLERLNRTPELIVLSACDLGLSSARPGNELLGMVAALLPLGTRSVIASVGLVPDTGATRRLVRAFHGFVAAGREPAEALATAQDAISDTPEGYLASAAFLCFGAG